MHIEPYLFFDGRCEEAIGFYQRALGAEVLAMMRNKDSPEPTPPGRLPAGSESMVLHASLRIGKSTVMLSDGHCAGPPDFRGFSLSIATDTVAEAVRLFNALAEGGTVQLPLAPTFWSPQFGMVVDRFGISWMLSVTTPVA